MDFLLAFIVIYFAIFAFALSCDVRRWWRSRQRMKQLLQHRPQRLRLVVGGRHDDE